jgi:hypothetical protein
MCSVPTISFTVPFNCPGRDPRGRMIGRKERWVKREAAPQVEREGATQVTQIEGTTQLGAKDRPAVEGGTTQYARKARPSTQGRYNRAHKEVTTQFSGKEQPAVRIKKERPGLRGKELPSLDLRERSSLCSREQSDLAQVMHWMRLGRNDAFETDERQLTELAL